MWKLMLVLLVGFMQTPGTPPTGGSKPTLNLPAQVQASPNKPFVVKLDTNCKWIRWTIPPGLERVQPSDTAYGESAFVGYGPANVYEFKVEGTLNDVYAEGKCVVFVGQTPGPPGPNPPKPPPGPAPSDPLFVELQRLYIADTSPQKAEHLDVLISIYSTAATQALKDSAISSTSQFFAKLRQVSSLLLPDTGLRGIRDTIKVDAAKQFSADEQMTDAVRGRIKTYFAHVATLLGGLK